MPVLCLLTPRHTRVRLHNLFSPPNPPLFPCSSHRQISRPSSHTLPGTAGLGRSAVSTLLAHDPTPYLLLRAISYLRRRLDRLRHLCSPPPPPKPTNRPSTLGPPPTHIVPDLRHDRLSAPASSSCRNQSCLNRWKENLANGGALHARRDIRRTTNWTPAPRARKLGWWSFGSWTEEMLAGDSPE